MAVYIDIVPGTVTTALWCPACLKPSGYEVTLLCLGATGVSTFGKLRKCYDCDAPLPPPAEDSAP